jgi:DNA polymerase-3 subunit epsilon
MNKIIVIDLETTGLNPREGLILEIGIIKLNLNTGDTDIIFDSYVKEPAFGDEHRNSWIFENSDLNFEKVENAPLLDDLRQEIQEIFLKYPITAFNKSFDLGFLKSRGFEFPKELPCIMITSTNICKIPSRNRMEKYKWPKAQEAWDFFFPNSDYVEKHRAADDAAHEAKILYEIYQKGLFSF